MNIWEKERQHFPLTTGDSIYLDHSTSGMIPDYAYQAMRKAMDARYEGGLNIEEYYANWAKLDALRDKIGKMFHCEGSQVVYGLSSTHLMNILANGIDLRPGDNVILMDNGYPGDNYVWMNKISQGVEIRFAKTDLGFITAEQILSYADERTKVICMSIVDNKRGFLHDFKTIGKLCRERGILFAADATQAANVIAIDMQEACIDFLATSGYKWMMSPIGVGAACIDVGLLPKLSQSQAGWVGTNNRRYNDSMVLDMSTDARRFEYGGLNFLGYYAFDAAVEHNLSLGAASIEEHVKSMVNAVYERAPKELRQIRLYNEFPEKYRAQVISFLLPKEWNMDTLAFQALGLRCRVFEAEGLLRVGFHYMNLMSDVDRLFACLRQIETQHQ